MWNLTNWGCCVFRFSVIPRKEQYMTSMVKKGLKGKCPQMLAGQHFSKLGMDQMCNSDSTPGMPMTSLLNFSASRAHLVGWGAAAVVQVLGACLVKTCLVPLGMEGLWVQDPGKLLPLRINCLVDLKSCIKGRRNEWRSQGKFVILVGKCLFSHWALSPILVNCTQVSKFS